jgi:oligoendopeptidase F
VTSAFKITPISLNGFKMSMVAPPITKLPKRQEVKLQDTWDLSRLFVSDEEWETAFKEFERQISGYESFKGRLASGDAKTVKDCFDFDSQLNRLAERLGNYAFLKTAEDQTNSTYQRMIGRFQNIATRASEAGSFIRPEILSIPMERMNQLLADPLLKLHRLNLERLARYKQHTLSEQEERLLAMQGEMAQAPSQIFRQLHDADLKFGSLQNEDGEEIELSPSTYSRFMISPQREVRRKAFHQFYTQYEAHKNSLAAILSSSVQKDIYYSRARGFDSALHSALYDDNVPLAVYDSLISSVRKNLPALYRFYELRRRKMGLPEIHHYDTYVPILSDIEVEHNWEQAVEVVCESLHPLGEEYVSTLRKGLSGRWCDRYPNSGKQSGAFSAGSYDGDPYILMNFQPKVLNDVFTLTHEAGHSMHSWYSVKNQPYEYYNYTIFVAEVASTFNEQLLTRHLLANARDDRFRAYLINNEIDGIRATIIRQTMFAEFEKTTHEMAESGEPLTVEALQSVYGKLLNDYFGPDFVIDEQLKLECLRIPHFYRAFYVYQYATGLSAAIALSQRVIQGGRTELDDYLRFLRGGCSKYPLDLLRDAGVDLEQAEPVDTALQRFASLVDELDQLLC